MNPGPCVLCGDRNYSNSMGGPYICPSCDAGMKTSDLPEHVRNYVKETFSQFGQFDEEKPMEKIETTPVAKSVAKMLVNDGWVADARHYDGDLTGDLAAAIQEVLNKNQVAK